MASVLRVVPVPPSLAPSPGGPSQLATLDGAHTLAAQFAGSARKPLLGYVAPLPPAACLLAESAAAAATKQPSLVGFLSRGPTPTSAPEPTVEPEAAQQQLEGSSWTAPAGGQQLGDSSWAAAAGGRRQPLAPLCSNLAPLCSEMRSL